MYAIIRVGGKQAKVREGDVLDVERIKQTGPVTFRPLLVVGEDGTVVAERERLAEAAVTADVVGETRGPKIDIFKYKAKTGYRRRSGHRQTYTRIRITGISLPDAAAEVPADEPVEAAAADEEA